MTRKKDLKRRVRDRQAATGESYVTALRHVRNAADDAGDRFDPDELDPEPDPEVLVLPIPVVELIDLTEIGEALGMRCRISMYPELLDHLDICATLTQFRSALRRSQLADMRGVVLDGEPYLGGVDLRASMQFYRKLREGKGGTSEDGRMMALSVDGKQGPVLVAFLLWVMPMQTANPRPPSLLVTSRAAWGLP